MPLDLFKIVSTNFILKKRKQALFPIVRVWLKTRYVTRLEAVRLFGCCISSRRVSSGDCIRD